MKITTTFQQRYHHLIFAISPTKIFFRTLLNSPLLRRKRGGFDNKSSLDSSEEELNTCPASNSPSPTPRHRLLQVKFSFFNSAQFWGLWFRIEYSIVIIVPFISGETGQTQTGWLSEPRDFPEAKTQTESKFRFVPSQSKKTFRLHPFIQSSDQISILNYQQTLSKPQDFPKAKIQT